MKIFFVLHHGNMPLGHIAMVVLLRILHMNDTQSQTESLLDIVAGIKQRTIMLPEFQRDFRWELPQTYDLFDSLIRDIFIGTVIYGKPSFEMTLREIDTRPRKGKGANAPLVTHYYSAQQITTKSQTQNLRIVLDGQQRLTSLYRAITGEGNDSVFVILHEGIDLESVSQKSLEELVDRIAGEESRTAISVKLSLAYLSETDSSIEPEDQYQWFADTVYGRDVIQTADLDFQKKAERAYRRILTKLTDLFKQQKMVAFYLLDMSLDKFCLFFERSNSRGIQLNFTDILAAKLYHGFNLRAKIEEFESQAKIKVNREIIIRAIAYIVGSSRGRSPEIDKKYILETLNADDFNTYWDEVCRLYRECLGYLTNQHYILSQDWMPFENMVIPLMMFLRQIKSFDRMNEQQRSFLEFWYWASIFANRYSSASNATIIIDCKVLIQVAHGERIDNRSYFMRLRSLVTESLDLLSYTKKTSSIYRGILNLINYAAKGLRDWSNAQILDVSMRLEDHHIYPRGYITSKPELDIDHNEAEQLVDCVVNRTLIPKIKNITIGKKAPYTYLADLATQNSQLSLSLATHLLPKDFDSEPTWNTCFKLFLEERAQALFALIDKYVIEPLPDMIHQHAVVGEATEQPSEGRKPRFNDMVQAKKVVPGDQLYTKKYPQRRATVVDGETVEYDGVRYPINVWGEKVTGWSSINIYDSVILERTGKPLRSLREEG